MASQHKITIGVDFQASVGNIQNAVKNIQSSLQSLKFPPNMAKSFESTFSRLETEFTKFSAKASSKEMTFGDFRDMEKSGRRIIELYNQLKVQIKSLGNLSDTELKKIFPDSFTGDVKKASAAWKAYEADIKKVTSATKNQEAALKKLQKTQSSQKQALDSAKKKTVVSDAEFRSLQNQQKAAKARATKAVTASSDVFARYEAAKKTKIGNLDMRQSGAKELLAEFNAAKASIDEANAAVEKFSKKIASSISTSGLDKLQSEYDETTKKVQDTEQEIKDLQKLGSQNAFDKLKKSLGDLGEDTQGIENTEEGLQQLYNIIERLVTAVTGQLRGSMDQLGTECDQSAKHIDRLGQEMDQAGREARELNSSMNDIDGLKQQVTYFFGLQNAIQLARRAMTSTVETIKELDAAMTETAVVTDFSVGDMWETLPQYTDMANDLGVAIKDVYNASTLYYQQGLKTNQVTSLTNETLKMARIGGLEAADATDRMTNALRGFNMEINETNAQRINDVYSNLAAISAANTDEISNAMTKTASIAANAGASYENTAAFLTQIIETTRESSETAGTALKTIIARFNEMKVNPNEITEVDGEEVDYNKIDSALKSVGISLKDTSGQIRDFDDIILELSGKWDTLDKNTRSYIATTAAGSRQQSRFIALMSNNARLTELVSEANNSAGASNKQFEKTLDSMETKLQKLKNAWDSFLLGITNNEIIKAGVDFLTILIEGVNNFTEALGPVGQILSRILVLILGLKAGQKIFDSLFNGLSKFSNLGARNGVKNGLIAGATAAGPIVEEIVEESVKKGAREGMAQGQTQGEIFGPPKPSSLNSKTPSTWQNIKDAFSQFKGIKGQKGSSAIAQSFKNNGGAKIFEFSNFKSNFATKGGKSGGTGGAIGGAIAGAAAGSWAAGKISDALYGTADLVKNSLEPISEAANSVQDSLNNLSTKIDEIPELKDKYEDLQKVLNVAEKGTKDYSQAIKESNSTIRNLIRNNPELAKSATYKNGEWKVDDGFWSKYEQNLLDQQSVLENSLLVLNNRQDSLEYIQQRQRSGIDTTEFTDEEKENAKKAGQTVGGLTGAAGGAIAGLYAGAAIGTIVPVLGNIIGGIIGTIAGAVIGGIAGGAIGGVGVSGAMSAYAQSTGIDVNKFEEIISKFGEEGWTLDEKTLLELKNNGSLDAEQQEIKDFLESTGEFDKFLDGVSNNAEQFNDLVTTSEFLKQRQIEYATELARAKELLTDDKEQNDRIGSFRGLGTEGNEDTLELVWNAQTNEQKTEFIQSAARAHGYSAKKNESGEWIYTDAEGVELTEEQTEEVYKSYFAQKRDAEQISYYSKAIEDATPLIGQSATRTTASGSDPYRTSEEEIGIEDYLSQIYHAEDTCAINIGHLTPSDSFNSELGGEMESRIVGLDASADLTLQGLAEKMNMSYQDFLKGFSTEGLTGNEQFEEIIEKVKALVNVDEDYAEKKTDLESKTDTLGHKVYDELDSVAAGTTANVIEEIFGTTGTKLINSLLGSAETDEQKATLANALGNISEEDLKTEDGIKRFVASLEEAGFDLSKFGGTTELVARKLVNSGEDISTVNKKVLDSFDGIRELSNQIKTGEKNNTFTKEEYDKIIGANPLLQTDFEEVGDDWIYVGESAYSLAKALDEATAAQLAELKSKVNSGSATASEKAQYKELLATSGTTQEILNSGLEDDEISGILDAKLATTAGTRFEYEKRITKLQKEQIELSNEQKNRIKAQVLEEAKLEEKAQNVYKVVEDTRDTLKDPKSNNYAEAIQNLTTAVEDYFGVAVGTEFVEQHKKDIQKMADGDIEAYNRVKEAVDRLDIKDKLSNFIELDEKDADKTISNVQDLLSQIDGETATIKVNGEADMTGILANLAAVMGGAQEAIDFINSLEGYEVVSTPEFNSIEVMSAGFGKEGNFWDKKGGNAITRQVLTGMKYSVKKTGTGTGSSSDYNGFSGIDRGRGSGGGGSDSKYEPDYDKFYNHLEKINSLLRKREKLEKRYQQMIDKGSHTADNLYKNHKKQLSLIKQEKSAQEEMVKLRNQEMKDYLSENSDLSKYATYKNGMISINRDAIYAITDSEKGEKVDTYISKLEEIRDQIQEAEDAVIDLEDALIEEERRFKENYESFEEQVYDAVVASREREIEALSSLNTTITNAASELLDGVQKNLDQIRQERENEKTEQDLADKQARLAYLRLDTSGANASEIKALEKELGEAQEDYTDTLIDQKINELQKQNDEAAKQREKQIKLLEDSLAIDKQTGALWPQVYDLIKNDLNIKGVAPGSKLDDLLKRAAEYFGKSASQKENYNKETNLKAQEAYNYGREGQFARNSFDSFVRSKGLGIDANSDIQSKINEALSNGNWSLAKDLETARNLKIDAGLAPSGTKKTYTYQNIGEDWAAIMPKLYGIRPAYYAAWKARVQKVKDIEGAYYENFDYTHIINEAKEQGQTEWQKLAEYYRNKKLGKKGVAPSKIPAYLHGGLVDMTGPAWLDGTKSRPEIVLNAKDTQNFLELTEALRASNHNLGTQNSKNGDIFFNIDIHVDQLASDYDVDQVANQVKRIIQTDAQWRNVNAVGNIR